MVACGFSFFKLKEMKTEDKVEYLKQRIKMLDNEDYILLQPDESFKIIPYQTMQRVYLGSLEPHVKKQYLKNVEHYTPILEINKPFINEDERTVNMIGRFKHKYIEYKEHSEKAKEGVEIAKQYIRDVWCSGNEEQFNYIIKWLSNVVKGKKNQTALYVQGQQGIGKSTLTQFLMDYVIGESLSIESGSEPLRSSFNKILMGKVLVVFEELENSTKNEWYGICSKLKKMITSDKCNYEQKYEKTINAKNLNNYIIITNEDAIKDDDGRRYFNVELTTKYKDNFSYFSNLRRSIMNDEAGKAFYSYLMELDTKNFFSGSMPITKNKLNKKAVRLALPYKFIKDEYILKTRGIDSTVGDLHSEFKNCTYSKESKISFNKYLSDIGINYYKSNSRNKYKVSHDKLLKIAKKNNWLHELDEFVKDDGFEFIDNEPLNSITLHEHEKQINSYEERIKELEQEIEKLKNDKKTKKEKKEKKTKKEKKEKKKDINKDEEEVVLASNNAVKHPRGKTLTRDDPTDVKERTEENSILTFDILNNL